MNYEEMSDFKINTRVGMYIGKSIASSYENVDNGACFELVGGLMTLVEFNPCNNPSDAWPIIIESKIGIAHVNGTWMASSVVAGYDEHHNDNPLRAAMIVFLMMQEQAK